VVARVADWPHSSFHRYVERGILPADWGGGGSLIDGRFGECGGVSLWIKFRVGHRCAHPNSGRNFVQMQKRAARFPGQPVRTALSVPGLPPARNLSG
jgi:hypothetical protein